MLLDGLCTSHLEVPWSSELAIDLLHGRFFDLSHYIVTIGLFLKLACLNEKALSLVMLITCGFTTKTSENVSLYFFFLNYITE